MENISTSFNMKFILKHELSLKKQTNMVDISSKYLDIGIFCLKFSFKPNMTFILNRMNEIGEFNSKILTTKYFKI